VDITSWLETARKQAGRAINGIMTATYWRIGQRIFEQEQRGNDRAGYGERLVEQLAEDLTSRFGRGFSRANVFQMRQFYLAHQIVQTASGQLTGPEIVQTVSGQSQVFFPLSWSHYVRLLTVADDKARDYYENEALRGGWSVRELDRQIATRLIIAFGRSVGALPFRALRMIPILTSIFATLSSWSSWILKMNTQNRIWRRPSFGSWNAFCLNWGTTSHL
jgi:hypothetical protein